MTEPQLLANVGARIKELRIQKNISQNDLALQCDIQKASMSRIEAGKTNITMRTLYKIITALDADVKDFFVFQLSMPAAQANNNFSVSNR